MGEVKTVNSALRGGGAHGAVTWGVLERRLERDDLGIEGSSGTSAGAMHAAVVAHGLARDGNAGARAALRRFWTAIGAASRFGPLQPSPLDRWLGGGNGDSSTMREMRAIDVVGRPLDEGQVPRGRYERLNLHGIDAEPTFRRLGVSSTFDADPGFLAELFDLGRRQAARRLEANLARVGAAGTLDLATFL